MSVMFSLSGARLQGLANASSETGTSRHELLNSIIDVAISEEMLLEAKRLGVSIPQLISSMLTRSLVLGEDDLPIEQNLHVDH